MRIFLKDNYVYIDDTPPIAKSGFYYADLEGSNSMMIISDKRNINPLLVENEEGILIGTKENVITYFKEIQNEPNDLGDRVKIGNVEQTGAGDKLLTTSSNIDEKTVEVTQRISTNEVFIKKKNLIPVVETDVTAYQPVFSANKTSTQQSSSQRYSLQMDIAVIDDKFLTAINSKTTTSIDNGNLKVFNLTQSPPDASKYRDLSGHTGWYISKAPHWRYNSDTESGQGLGFNLVSGDISLGLEDGFNVVDGQAYRFIISADNEFTMLGSTGISDPFGSTQFVPFVKRTYTGEVEKQIITEDEINDGINIKVVAGYEGTLSNTYSDIQSAIDSSIDGDVISVSGSFDISSDILLTKGVSLIGAEGCSIGYASYNSSNGKVFYQNDSSSIKSYRLENILIRNAGDYGLRSKSSDSFTLKNVKFHNCGQDGLTIDLGATAHDGLLGYDSSKTDLSTNYSGSGYSGGCFRIEKSKVLLIDGCEQGERNNNSLGSFRGFRMQNCGIGGEVIVRNNKVFNTMEAPYYFASSTYNQDNGCENVKMYNNIAAHCGNCPVLPIGGEKIEIYNNTFSECWNTEIGWSSSELIVRDNIFDSISLSPYNAIGNDGDTHNADSAIAGAGQRVGTSFILEATGNKFTNKGLSATGNRIGFFMGSNVGSTLQDSSKGLVTIKNNEFNGHDVGIRIESNLDYVTLIEANNIFIQNAVEHEVTGNGGYCVAVDGTVILSPSSLNIKTAGQSVILNSFNKGFTAGELEAEAIGTKIRIKKKGTVEYIHTDLAVSTVTVNGVAVNSQLVNAVSDLNGIFDNPNNFVYTPEDFVSSGVVVGSDLTLTRDSGATTVIDVTTLTVDTDTTVISGVVSGNDLTLTMSAGSPVVIDITNLLNGSSSVDLSDKVPLLFMEQIITNSLEFLTKQVSFLGEASNFRLSNAPAGISIDSNTGLLTITTPLFNSGTPSANVYTFQCEADNVNGTGYTNISLVVISGVSGADVSGWTELQGNFTTTGADQIEDTVASYDTVLTSDKRFEFPYISQGYLGVPNGTTPVPNTDVYLASEWNLRVELGVTGIVDASNVGWDAILNVVTYDSSSTFFLEYRTDTYIYLVIDDVDVLKTTATYTGDFTIFHGTPNAYTVNSIFPVFTLNNIPSSGGGGGSVCTAFDGALYSTGSAATDTIHVAEYPLATTPAESPLIHTGGTATDWSMVSTFLFNSAGVTFMGLFNGKLAGGASWYVPNGTTTKIYLNSSISSVPYAYQNGMIYTMIFSYDSASFTLTATLIDTVNLSVIFTTSVTNSSAANNNYFTGGKFGVHQSGTNASSENISYGIEGALVDLAFYDRQVVDVLGADIKMWKNPAAYADTEGLTDKNKTKLYAFSDTGSNDSALANMPVVNQIDQTDTNTLNVLTNYNNVYGVINIPNLTGNC